MEPLAGITRLAARVGEPIETAEDIALAEEMLEAASAEVRFYGLDWLDEASAPAVAVNITLAAAARGFQNPAGYAKERSDAANLERSDAYSQGVELTASEQARLKTFTRRGSTRTVQTTNPDRFVARNDVRHAHAVPGFMRRGEFVELWSEKQLLIDQGRLPEGA